MAKSKKGNAARKKTFMNMPEGGRQSMLSKNNKLSEVGLDWWRNKNTKANLN